MATNDEKRRVAAELRESIPDGNFSKGEKGWSVLYFMLFGHYMPNQRSAMTYREVASRLADLIDPDTTTDTAKTVEDTTKHVCDATATVTDMSATRDMSQSCRSDIDRAALLALADDVDGAADDSGGFEPLTGMLRDIARGIRVACGVEECDGR